MADIREQLQRTRSGNYTLERELGGGGAACSSRLRLSRLADIEAKA